MKGFSTTPVKAGELRQMIHAGKFASWLEMQKALAAAISNAAAYARPFPIDCEMLADANVVDTFERG